jgi:hypothetical protein
VTTANATAKKTYDLFDVTKSGRASAYFIFDRDIRKQINSENPGLQLGDVSRIIGQRWRELTLDEREKYGNRARDLNLQKRQYAAGTGDAVKDEQVVVQRVEVQRDEAGDRRPGGRFSTPETEPRSEE